MQIEQNQVVPSFCTAGWMPCTLGFGWIIPHGTPGKMGDGVIRGYSQGQATRMTERRGASSTDSKHYGPAGTSTGKQPEEHVLRVQISTTTQQGRAQLPSSVPAMPEQGQLLPQPPLCTVAILPQNYSSLLFLFKHPGKCEADFTLPTLGRYRGLPCLPVGNSLSIKRQTST